MDDLLEDQLELMQMEERLFLATSDLDMNSLVVRPSSFLHTQHTENSCKIMAFVGGECKRHFNHKYFQIASNPWSY